MNKVMHIFIYFTLVSATILVWLVVFWSIYPYKVSSVVEPIEILNENNEIAIGEKILMKLVIYKPNELVPTGIRFITCNDGNLVTMNNLAQNYPVGNYEVVSDIYTLPPKVAVGSECQFHFKNVYEPNPIRDIIKEWSSEPFTVKGAS